ncbi:MAG TPA: FGGY-family carbohydrate kinase [Polyangiaceae bacterium]
MKQYVLAIDLGTSGPKVALVTLDGEVLLHEFRPNRLILVPGGGAEQDPEEWWQTIRDGIQSIVAKNVAAVRDIVAISISSQWFGTVAVDAQCRHLANALIWLDQRGAEYVARQVGGGLEVPGTGYNAWRLWRWIRLTGAVPSRTGKDPVGHILAIKHERPDLYRAAYKFLEPMDYLTFRLTGRATASYASATGYFCTDNRDLKRVAYDPELVELSGFDGDKLPELVPTGSVVGTLTVECARELGLHEGVKVVTSSADTASAAIGAGAVEDYRAHLYIGTSAWISCHVPFKKTDLTRNIASLPSAIPDRYWVATEQDAAGKCLSWLVERVLYGRDELASEEVPRDVYARLDRLAARAPAGSGGLLFLPWLNGERTPVDDLHVRGSWTNLSLNTDRSCLVRSVLEGVALNARWMLSAAEHFVKRQSPAGFESLRFAGGGARSDLWCQILSDVLDRRIERVKDPVLANTRGAALIAAVALGHLDWKAAAAKVEVDRVFQPDPTVRSLYDRKFEAFLRFYQQTKSTYAWLNAGT